MGYLPSLLPSRACPLKSVSPLKSVPPQELRTRSPSRPLRIGINGDLGIRTHTGPKENPKKTTFHRCLSTIHMAYPFLSKQPSPLLTSRLSRGHGPPVDVTSLTICGDTNFFYQLPPSGELESARASRARRSAPPLQCPSAWRTSPAREHGENER